MIAGQTMIISSISTTNWTSIAGKRTRGM